MDQPGRLRLVKDYPDNTNGPTIPFLLGALREDPDSVVSDEESRTELRDLISAVKSANPPLSRAAK